MAEIFRIPNSAVPFTRDEAEAILQALVDIQKVTGRLAGAVIERLDTIDGDPDDSDTSDAEDEHAFTGIAAAYGSQGAGCVSSDRDEVTWIEWQSRGRHKVGRFGGELLARGPHGNALHEDDEDTDPLEDDDEDRCEAGDDGCGAFFRHGTVHFGAMDDDLGCLLPVYGDDQTRGPLNPNGEDQELTRT